MVNVSSLVSQIIFERGVELQGDKGDWLSKSNCDKPTLCEPTQLLADYRLRPVVLTVNLNPSTTVDMLAPVSRGRLLEIEMSELTQIAPFQNAPFVMLNLDLSYTIGAVIYHCHRLAKAYVNVAQHFMRGMAKLDVPSSCVFADQPEPYYEFEALIAAARRFYTTLRRPMWAAFGNRGSVPSSFEKTVAACTRLPDALQKRLRDSWTAHGKQLKDYRDCMEHHAHLAHVMPYAFMERLNNGLWTAWARIPDNPQAKSAKNFRYNGGLDALTYGWTIADEVIKVAGAVIEQLPHD